MEIKHFCHVTIFSNFKKTHTKRYPEASDLLECNALSLGSCFPTFQISANLHLQGQHVQEDRRSDPESLTTLMTSRKETFSFQHTEVDYALRLKNE